jgi:hypothetical protein
VGQDLGHVEQVGDGHHAQHAGAAEGGIEDGIGAGQGAIIEGTYQSPILVQWYRGTRTDRTLDITLSRFV